MDNAILETQVRDLSVKTKHLRADGFIPATYYGHGVENVNIQMDYQTFRRLYRTAGENTIIELKIEGQDDKKVLVHDVDFHPVTGNIHHVEFINVRMDEKVTTHVAIHLEGQAPAVKALGGVLIQNLDEIEIRCLPGDLIHEVKLSVESLDDFHSALHVSDLVVPDNVEIITDQGLTVANVSAPRAEEVEEDVEAPDVASVEVAGETKEEGEGEAKEEGGE